MSEWKCSNCGLVFNSGFFNNRYCPKCRGWGNRFGKLVHKVIKISIVPVIVILALAFLNPPAFSRIADTTLAVLDSRVFYSHGVEAYTSGILRGKVKETYVLLENRPYYAEPVSPELIKNKKPVGTAGKSTVVLLGGIIRQGANVWAPVELYVSEKPVRAFLLLPRKWQDSVKVFDWDKAVAQNLEKYRQVVRNRYRLTSVKAVSSKEFQEEFPDMYKADHFGDKKTYFYAFKKDRASIERIYTYYMAKENLRVVILQGDLAYKRPALKMDNQENADE